MACDRILRDFVFDLFLETVQPLPRKLLERLQRRLLSPGRVCDVTPKINLKRTVQSEQKIVLSGTVKGFPFDGEDIVEILARAVEGFREVDWDECSVKLDLETDHLWTNLSQADRRRFHQYQAPCHGGSLTRAFRSQSVQEFVRSEEGIHERRRRPKKLPRRLKLGGEAQVESIFEGTPGTRPNRVFRPQTDEDYDFNREYEESLGAPILTDEPFFKLAASERRAIVHELNKSKKDVAMWFHYASMDSLALVRSEEHTSE